MQYKYIIWRHCIIYCSAHSIQYDNIIRYIVSLCYVSILCIIIYCAREKMKDIEGSICIQEEHFYYI